MGDRDNIIKYIQNEKDISRYKISFLQKVKSPTPSQKRILNIEKEFVSLPLENLGFCDIPDVAAAISIYRTSRSQFFDIYKIKMNQVVDESSLDLVNRKLSFIKESGKSFQSSKIEEINPIQNSDIYYDFIKKSSSKSGNNFDVEKKILDLKNLSQLLKIEPITIAKKRARCQAALYSIGEYLKQSIPNFDFQTNDFQKFELVLDNIISNVDNNIFSYYNDSIKNLEVSLKGTMGENNYAKKIQPLLNLLSFKDYSKNYEPTPISNASGFPKDIPVIGNLFLNSKKIINTTLSEDKDREVQNKVFGILLPVAREGNEKMSLLHKEIIFEERDISHLFSSDLSNVKAECHGKELYFKALLLLPLWRLYDIAQTDDACKLILNKLLPDDLKNFDNINFNDKNVISKINNNQYGFINISNKSRILSTRTRSEDEGISEIFSIIKSKILELKEEYNLLKVGDCL